jgi:hypothetical protein
MPIEFPPEFYGMATALWSTYSPAVWVWLAFMFSAMVLLGIGIVAYSIIRHII